MCSFWKQQSMHWLKKGDMDTKYFHALASSQNKIKYIGWLEDEEGRRVESQEEICSLLFDYFEGRVLFDIHYVESGYSG